MRSSLAGFLLAQALVLTERDIEGHHIGARAVAAIRWLPVDRGSLSINAAPNRSNSTITSASPESRLGLRLGD